MTLARYLRGAPPRPNPGPLDKPRAQLDAEGWFEIARDGAEALAALADELSDPRGYREASFSEADHPDALDWAREALEEPDAADDLAHALGRRGRFPFGRDGAPLRVTAWVVRWVPDDLTGESREVWVRVPPEPDV